MPKRSAGLLLYRRRAGALEVFLVHPGGPYWAKKDSGAWSLPKGEYDAGDDALAAALREFQEETGFALAGDTVPLDEIKQPGGKIITAWAIEGDCPVDVHSNTFPLEWPPRSGKIQQFPEIDRADWFGIEEAHLRILKGQAGFLNRLVEKVKDVQCP